MPNCVLAYQIASGDPKRIKWYESSHMVPDEAFQRMAEWLGTRIGIDASKFILP